MFKHKKSTDRNVSNVELKMHFNFLLSFHVKVEYFDILNRYFFIISYFLQSYFTTNTYLLFLNLILVRKCQHLAPDIYLVSIFTGAKCWFFFGKKLILVRIKLKNNTEIPNNINTIWIYYIQNTTSIKF